MLKRLDHYFKLPKRPVVCIYGLMLVHAWVENALVAILITHLTDHSLHLPKAAAIVNVQDGMTAILVLPVAYASDAHLGPFRAIVFTTISYISGLLLLFFAAWLLQSIEIRLLYVAVTLVALGRAGREISLKEFLADQFMAEGDGSRRDEKHAESLRKVWWRSAKILGICASAYLLTNDSWIKLCKISAIAMVVAFALFLGGSASYECKKPTKSISVDQVREVIKILRSMIPLSPMFLVYGLLQATGNTFFYEQVGYTDNHLGKISSVPVVIFVMIRTSTTFIVSRICDALLPSYSVEQRPIPVNLVRIGGGMAILPLCCIVAWWVEKYRLHKYVILDISISFLWLVPQFVLLGIIEGIIYDGIEKIFDAVIPESVSKYGPSCTQFALEIGNFISLASILLFHGLLNDDFNTSSLDLYYALLGCICFVNFLYAANHYVKEIKSSGDQVEQQLVSLGLGRQH